MAWNDANYFRSLGLHCEFGNRRVDGLVNTGGFGAGGQISETSATQINSTFAEMIPGITDGGVQSVNANAPLQSDIYETLRSSNVNGTIRPLNVWIGVPPQGYKNCDGKGFVVNEDVAYTAQDDSAGTVTVATTSVARGISVGDFIRPSAADDNAAAVRIKALSASGTALTITYDQTTSGNRAAAFESALDSLTENAIDIVRPSIMIGQSAYVAQFEHQAETDGIIQLILAFRKTGEAYHYVGNNDGRGSTPTSPDNSTLPTPSQRF